MQRMSACLVMAVLFLVAVAPGDAVAQKRKDRSRSKDKQATTERVATKSAEEAPTAPEWKEGDSPLSSLLWAARQLPDLSRFPATVSSIAFQAVVLKEDEVVFFDGCRIEKKKGFWKLSNCTSSFVGRTQPMGRLVTEYAGVAPDPLAVLGTGQLLERIRTLKRIKDLEPLLNPSGSKGKDKGHAQIDVMEADAKACGQRSWMKAAKSLPHVSYVGEHVVLWSVQYFVGESGSDGSVTLGLVRTKDGWRINEFRVACPPTR